MQGQNSFWKYKFNDWVRDFTSLGNPLILLLVPFAVLGPQSIFYTLLIALCVNELICSLIKLVFHKPRPDGQAYKGVLEKIDAGSFPSIHASRITLVYLTLFQFTDNLILKFIFILVIVVVTYSRVSLKRHYWQDIFGGISIGIIIFYLFNLL